ncbi:MAG: ferritin family protein [Planctomycetota bacterium]|jgi:rubrerythrin
MTDKLNIKEVFEMALQMEKDGAAFYKNAAKKTDDADIKNLLTNLSEMEDGHYVTFEKMLADVVKDVGPEDFDHDSESAKYLHAMVAGKIYKSDDISTNELANASDICDILEKAVLLEKEAVIYYLGIKNFIPESLGKDKIEAIINEEISHVNFLSETLENCR